MSGRRSSASGTTKPAGNELPPSTENLKLRTTGSFISPKQTGTREVGRLSRRHSSPALTQSISPNSKTSDDEVPNTLRRKSHLTTVAFNKSDYQELAGIVENSEEEGCYTEASAASEWLGMLHFSIRTMPDLERIIVDVEKANDLPKRGTINNYHPVIQLCLHPSEQIQVSKPAISLSPTFRESFYFNVSFVADTSRLLVLTAYDHDRPDIPIAHVTCPLFHEDMSTELVRHYQKPLSRISTIHEKLGELLISVTYVKPSQELKVTLLRGRDVAVTTNAQEMYLKASMMCAGEKIKSKKSKPTARVANPFFNHVFAFVVPSHYLDDLTMAVKLATTSVLKKDRLIGQVVINPFTRHNDHEMCFWQRVLVHDAPCRKWFVMTL